MNETELARLDAEIAETHRLYLAEWEAVDGDEDLICELCGTALWLLEQRRAARFDASGGVT